jgi:hypothetical protein
MAQISKIVPAEYYKFLPLFSEAEANKLPPHCPYDYQIPLKEGCTPPFGPIYSLSQTELEALQKWLEENLSKGFIRASSSCNGGLGRAGPGNSPLDSGGRGGRGE